MGLLLLVATTGFSQSKDTLYSDNICLYTGTTHTGDVAVKTQIIIADSVISFVNMDTDSVFTVTRQGLKLYQKFNDGSEAIKWNAIMDGKGLYFGILQSAGKGIKQVAISFTTGNGYIFIIVPKEAVLPNKNLITDVKH